MEKTTDEQRLARIQTGLKCSLEEAREILEYDKRVDRNESTEYDLTREEQKVAASYTRTGTRQVESKTSKPRNRKDNPTKAGIVKDIFSFLSQNASIGNLQIVNPERLISFQVGADKFEITLTQKRK